MNDSLHMFDKTFLLLYSNLIALYIWRWEVVFPAISKEFTTATLVPLILIFLCRTIHKILAYLIDLICFSVIAIYIAPSVDNNLIGQSSGDRRICR